MIEHAYADESGDTGYAFDAGSSRYFVMGILFPEKPEQTIDRILALRRILGKPATYEFHFRQADARARSSFFTAIQEEPVKFLAAIIHKPFAPGDFRRLGKLGVYSHALAGAGLRTPFALNPCKLHLDGSGKQKQFLQALKSNVRWACRLANRPTQSWGEIRLLESAHPLIQYADMVTGAVMENVNHLNSQWLDLVSHQAVFLWHERFEDEKAAEKRNSPD